MEHILYWLWLTGIFGVYSGKMLAYIFDAGGIERFYKSESYPNMSEMPQRILKKLNNKSLDWAKRVYEKCRERGIGIITYDDEKYPEVLRHTAIAPVVLYTKGTVPDWERLLMIGVVGTREASGYGIGATESICTELAEYGVTVVSGLAKGIDSAASRSAVKVGAYTIAVCSAGLDVNYPTSNAQLREAIIKNGLLISEYPPGTLPQKWTFRPRNRIIAGLCQGVLVSEAPKSSGSLITANWALEENRDVFAIPGKIDDANFKGANNLIKSGAKPVFSVDDILSEYPYFEFSKPEIKSADIPAQAISVPKKKKQTEEKKTEVKYVRTNPTEQAILDLLASGEAHIDEIMREIDDTVSTINTSLCILEIEGCIKRLAGNVFTIKKD